MKKLKESLLKNIHQDDKSIMLEWVTEFNRRYMHETLVDGVDFTIDGNVLNYKRKKVAVTGYIEIREKTPVKFGTMPLAVSGEDVLIRFSYDFKQVSDVIDENNFDAPLQISANYVISEIDMTKLKKVKSIHIYNCPKLKKITFHKRMYSIDVWWCKSLKEVGGCDIVDWFEMGDCGSLKTTSGFPRQVRSSCTLGNLKLDDVRGFPEKVGGNLGVSNVYVGEENLYYEVLSKNIKCRVGGAITK